MQSISAADRPVVDQLMSSLNAVVDNFGTTLAKSAEALVFFENTEQGRTLRSFAILCLPCYSPKYQIWAVCEWSNRNTTLCEALALQFPFEVDIRRTDCEVSMSGDTVDMVTTAQLAVSLARRGQCWSLGRLEYSIPARGDLLASLVAGVVGDMTAISGPGVKVKVHQRGRVFNDPALSALRHRPLQGVLEAGAAAAAAFPPIANVGLGGDGDGDVGIDGDLQRLALAGAPPDDDEVLAALEDVDDETAAELLDYHFGDDGSDEGDANGDGGDLGGQELPAAPPAIVGPTPLGYFNLENRAVGRLTKFGRNLSMRCYMHARCSTVFIERRRPTDEQLISWLGSGEPSLPTDSRVEKDKKVDDHLEALKLILASIESLGPCR
jgi:hypothetical protein